MEEDHGVARKRQREKWRRDWIVRFAKRQCIARRWIAFVDLADWGAHSTTAASAEAEEQARELVYRRLSESLLAGAFEQAGRSRILYLDPHVTLDGVSPRYRLTREQFEIAFEATAAPPPASLPLIVLSSCWLPRELARHWLESHGYRWAPHFEPVQDTAREGADMRAFRCDPALWQHATDQSPDRDWVHLRDGEGFIGEIWPKSSAQERHEVVIAILFAAEISKSARLKGDVPQERDITDLLASGDRRDATIDIPNGRIVLRGRLLPLWPGGPPKLPQGEDAKWELEQVRFARASAQAYAVQTFLPKNLVPFLATGAPGRPSKGMHVIRIEFDRRRGANECKSSLGEEATERGGWFRRNYPTAQPVKRKTIENNIRSDYRVWASDRRPREP